MFSQADNTENHFQVIEVLRQNSTYIQVSKTRAYPWGDSTMEIVKSLFREVHLMWGGIALGFS